MSHQMNMTRATAMTAYRQSRTSKSISHLQAHLSLKNAVDCMHTITLCPPVTERNARLCDRIQGTLLSQIQKQF